MSAPGRNPTATGQRSTATGQGRSPDRRSTPPSPPALLTFDTSTNQVAVAAFGPAGPATWNGPGGAAASANLLPAIHEVLARAGLGMGDLHAVAFGAGPGAFTGLRTACAVAQGLAFGLGCPVVPVDSLALVAEDAWPVAGGADADEALCWVAMDARMDEVYAGAYRRAASGWEVVVAPALYALPALAERWHADPPLQVAGSAVTAFAGRLPWGEARCVATESDRASAMLRVALQAWHRGEAIAPERALPVYLRDKVAQTTAERLALRAPVPADVPAPAGR
jgi:tRNA threonylcarbamoyladenosine biosynthesis protein TsaB